MLKNRKAYVHQEAKAIRNNSKILFHIITYSTQTMTIASTPAKIDKTVKKSQVKDCRINHKLP